MPKVFRVRFPSFAVSFGSLLLAAGCSLVAEFDPAARGPSGEPPLEGGFARPPPADASHALEPVDGSVVVAKTFCDDMKDAAFCADFDRDTDPAAGWHGTNTTSG